MTKFTAACIQLNAQDDLAANIAAAEKLIRDAAAQDATFITLPENAFFMSEPGKKHPSPEPALDACKALARELSVWILIGSVQLPSPGGKSWNRSVLINASGETVAQYDKIHLFDVTLKNGEVYAESARVEGGNEAVLAHTPWGKLGMTVCYDVRFAHLYRTLAQTGADFLSIPAAFTYTTGTAHWHTLLRARAIENGCYVFAPAQCGRHPGKRRTYGHSLIIDPWGEILAEGSEESTGFVTATIDTDKIAEVRASIPALKGDRAFGIRSY